MRALVTLAIAAATLAFGSVYPWAYIPLYVIAATIGVAGIVRHRGVGDLRTLALGLALAAAAIGVQVCPLPMAFLDRISPGTRALLGQYDLSFSDGGWHALSLNRASTVSAFWGVAAFAVYFLGLARSLSMRDARKIAADLTVLAVGLALVGIYVREHHNGLVYGFWHAEQAASVDSFGPFVNRNHFAGWMLMAACLALGLLCGRVEAEDATSAGKTRAWFASLSSAEAGKIVLTGAALGTMIVALIWTLSRSGIASLACAFVCAAVVIGRRRQIRVKRRAFAIGLLGSVLLMALSWRGLGAVVDWFVHNEDVQTRVLAWRDGWQVVRDFPLVGTGLNTYPDAMLFYQRHLAQWWLTHAHNDYLQLMAEGGLLVCVPALATVALFITLARRRLQAASASHREYWLRVGAVLGLVAIGAQEIVEFSLHIPANAFLFSTLAAFVVASTRRPAEPRP